MWPQQERAIESGLTSIEANTRLKIEGFNELPSADRRPIFKMIKDVITEPMFSLLLLAGLVSLFIGDLHEAVLLSILCFLSVIIVIVQEWRSEHVLEALRDLTSPRAMVIRDGKAQRIAGRNIVRGDILLLAEGDRVPADAKLLSEEFLYVDESLLTGESMPVQKILSGSGDLSLLFSGSMIVQGSGKAITLSTGLKSKIGKLGQQLRSIDIESPRLQIQIKKIVRIFAILSLIFAGTSTILYGYFRHNWPDAIMSGLALGMSLLPEEFPLVLTVFMVMGAWRISRANVLTRKASAIETLGSATVLCTDKTGTLTQNKMSIAFMKAGKDQWLPESKDISEALLHLLMAGKKACRRESYDPMDLAFLQNTLNPQVSNENDVPCAHYGIKPGLLIMANVYHGGLGEFCVFAKGAPEAIAKACHLNAAQMEALHQDIDIMAAQGIRMLAVAEASYTGENLPQNADGFDYRFLGLVGFADPLRENIPTAVAQCRSAGIRIIMITGDYPATAGAIARQAGINADNIITGERLKTMTDSEMQNTVRDADVFARVTPDQKLRIVTALKNNNDIVAMIGDGVNDAPSLKAAHIGVAMGGRGTDVAREASSIVLLDDNFFSLVQTFSLGRRINDNLRKAMIYITAIHVPIAGLTLIPLVFNTPLILTPLLIAMLEMIVDPVCSIVLEAEKEEKDVMKRPPRKPDSPLLSANVILWGMFQGSIMLLVISVAWYIGSLHRWGENEIRSLVFISLITANFMLILLNRSFSSSLWQAFRRGNPFLGWGSLFIFAIFSLFLYVPSIREIFSFGEISGLAILYIVISGMGILLFLEFVKKCLYYKIMQ